MRIAYTTGLLRVPPTYFVVQHGERLIASGDHEAAVFALATDIADAGLRIDVSAAVPDALGPFTTRQYAAVSAGGRQARMLADYAPDVVHQHFATWATGALDGARRASAPCVVTLHGYDVFAAASDSGTPLARFHRRSTTAVQRDAAKLLVVSRYLADRAVQAGYSAERMSVHYQGIDTEFFSPRAGSPPAHREGPPTVVFVGALEARKGILDLVEASTELARRHDHRLIVVGEGKQRAQVDAASANVDHITATGPLDREQIRSLLRSARLFVLPTQRDGDWREAAGLVLLEAQACGVPVVTYDSGGAPEMVKDGSTGVVVPEGDIAALMSAMDGVLSLRDREWRALSARAREWVVAERSLARSVNELVEHYRELV